tara:strand:- start:6678 stop:6818 length:141 start_codon:yes stop_codon:yes gene_type:complete
MKTRVYNESYPQEEGQRKRKRYILSGAAIVGASVGLYLRAKRKKGD